ncbi:MAG: Hsp20 family protein [Atopobiaceae bacterium]|nr:Hsp20 family protein [Atopobiaceae bacterium]MBR1830595.1 Hsp20 family protein [Atopobiaceae bacterium]
MASLIPYSNYDRALRRAFPFDMFDELLSSPLVSAASDGAFKMDVEDAGTSYVVTAELPGVNKDEIDVELNEGRLSISVDKRETEEHKAKNFLHKETHEWSASRGVYLKDAATAGLTAKLDGGVLTITVPKQEEKVNVTKVSID